MTYLLHDAHMSKSNTSQVDHTGQFKKLQAMVPNSLYRRIRIRIATDGMNVREFLTSAVIEKLDKAERSAAS